MDTKDSRLEEINENLEQINYKLGNTYLAFFKGLLSGFGSVLGAGIAIILIGWFLNAIGVVPAFQRQAEEWRRAFQIETEKNLVAPSDNIQDPAQP